MLCLGRVVYKSRDVDRLLGGDGGARGRGGVPFGERSEPTFLIRRAAGAENFGLKGRFP